MSTHRSNSAALVALCALFAASGCTTAIALTEAGRGVSHIAGADTPGGCRLIGDVAIGVPPDAARPRTEGDLVILMRNKAAEIGASHVVLESSTRRTDASSIEYYMGRGIAYACPPSADEGMGEGAADEGAADEGIGDEGIGDEGIGDEGAGGEETDEDALP